ncbi:MAG: OmpH/Skp family outer membrane protein [Candidatus Xenobia bacterium]
MNLKRITAVLALCGTLLVAGCNPSGKGGTNPTTGNGSASPAPVLGTNSSTVAMIDPQEIYKLPEYVDLEKQIEGRVNDLKKKLEDEAKTGKSQADLQAENLKDQAELEQFRAEKQKPLNDKVNAIIGEIAKQKGITVVLDKQIVVTGLQDITDDVKTRFENEKNVPTPSDSATPGDNSGVGYVNQETISTLKMFQDTQAELVKYYKQLGDELQRKLADKKLGAVEKGQLQELYSEKFQAKREELYGPLQDKVNSVISQVAKDQGLSLVLDTHQVMWGGKNITTDVISKLVKG